MATRQRLQAVLDARRASRPCWSCALRYSSTSAGGIQDSSKTENAVLYRPVLWQKYKGILASLMLDIEKSYTEAATEDLDGLEGASSQTVPSKFPAPEKHTELAPSFRTHTSIHRLPPPRSEPAKTVRETRTLPSRPSKRTTTSVLKDVISTGNYEELDPSIRTHLSNHRTDRLPPQQSEPAEVVREVAIPLIRTVETATSRVLRKIASPNRHGELAPFIYTFATDKRNNRLSWNAREQRIRRPRTQQSKPVEVLREADIPRIQTIEMANNRVIRKTTFLDKLDKHSELAPFIRTHSTDKRNNSLSYYGKKNLIRRRSNELTSLLDEYRDLTSKVPKTSPEPGATRSGLPYSPSSPLSSQHYARRPALNWSHTPVGQSPQLSEMLFSTFSTRAANRNYATAANQLLQTAAQISSPATGITPAGLVQGRPEGIREALRLWQEQHDSAVADSFGRTAPSTFSDTQNLLTQSEQDDSFTTLVRDDEMDDDDGMSIEPDEQDLDKFAPQIFLRRGDLVELLVTSKRVLAIFIRYLADQCQFYTMQGAWVNREELGARWAVSRFVDPDDLNEILPYLPAEEVTVENMNLLHPIDVHAPRGAGAKVIEQMLRFQRATDAVFRQHAERINRLYEIIAPSQGHTDRVMMSLKDITMKVLMKEDPSELTQPMMWAVHRAVSETQNISYDAMNLRQKPIYEVFPQQGLKYIHQVRDWVREYQEKVIQEATNEPMSSSDLMLMESTLSHNPLATFVQKARLAIRESRQTRPLSKSGFIGPSSISIDVEGSSNGKPYREVKKQEFDSQEKIIIHYLDVWTTSSYLNSGTNLASLGPIILRAVGMYEGLELNRSIGHTLLQELGVLMPWENKTVHAIKNLHLPGHDDGSSEASRLLRDASSEAKNFEPKDSMEGLRKDWGDMPVFCVDSARTVERDDGFSLELVENDPSAYWVHIHVANPSAFISPDSASARFAASLGESIYFPEKKYPMLNSKVTKDLFGLANNRPCITFSAKVSADGDTLEKKITPGIVRNVHYLTPQAVSLGLGLTEADGDPESESVSLLNVGGRVPIEPIDDLVQTSEALTDPEHISVLRKLYELVGTACQKRIQTGAPDFYKAIRLPRVYPTVYTGNCTGGDSSPIMSRNIRQFEGDPIISIQRHKESWGLIADMIMNTMIIAGNVGASWCAERNIPIPYRGIVRNHEPASSPEAFKRDVLDPKVAEYGSLETSDLRRYMRLVGLASISDRPLEHIILGLAAYCKATSPLRRYIDMYTHWQIEAAIRHEAATGTSLVGSTDESYLPFSRAQVAEFVMSAWQRERKVATANNKTTRHWICQALFRAFHFNEATLPETVEVRTTQGRALEDTQTGWWDLIDTKVRMSNSPAVAKAGGHMIGDVWEARLEGVDPYFYNVFVEPIRLLAREGGIKREEGSA